MPLQFLLFRSQPMNAIIPCDACGQQYAVPPQAAGRRFTCRKCGANVDVPSSVVWESVLRNLPIVDPPSGGPWTNVRPCALSEILDQLNMYDKAGKTPVFEHNSVRLSFQYDSDHDCIRRYYRTADTDWVVEDTID
jgi:hypothetical protein